ALTKSCINKGYKKCYEKAIIDTSVRDLLKTVKTKITLSSGIGTLPVDFFQKVSIYYSDTITELSEDIKYKIHYTGIGYQIIFDETLLNMDIYIQYIKIPTDMSADTDLPLLPVLFDNNILDFALVEYFKIQRDWGNIANSMQLAEGELQRTIDNFWQE
ncbi:hypothetical protein EOM39_07500, partial [Candidatus Gracilibacteria bacterium]|nr:hypothetical protein [Candidatus Gracilibacteria bacterium]